MKTCMETRSKMSADRMQNQSGDVQNRFCWTCHKRCQKIPCPKCFRSYHEKCLRSTDNCCWNDEDNSLVSCTVCTVKETSKEASVDKQPLLDMLKYTMVDISNNPDFQVFTNLTSLKMVAKPYDGDVNPIDEINQKINSQAYESFYAFLVDIENIVNNCYALLGERHELTKNAINLFKFCERETRAISSCAECYENKHLHPNEWRTMACSKPHLVLLARLNRSLNFWPVSTGPLSKWFTHWPAKLIGVDDDKLKIIFFEWSEFIEISANDCWIYTTRNLSSMKRYFDLNKIKIDLKEVDLYAKNIEKKFGRFDKELPCIRFDQNYLDDHIIRMFPDYNSLTKIVPTKSRSIDNDDCPAKRRRLTADIAESPSDDSTNATTIKKCMRIIEHETTELGNNKDSKLQTIINELNISKKAFADAQEANRKLVADLQSVTSERDRTKEMLARSDEIHASEVAVNNEAHRRQMGQVRLEIVSVRAVEQTKAEMVLKRAKLNYDEKIRELEAKLQSDHSESVLNISNQLQEKHKHDLDVLCIEHKCQIDTKTKGFSIKIQEIEQRTKKIADNLVIMASDLSGAKAALNKAKEDHTKETATLNELHNQNMANAKKDVERILAEKMTAEVRLRKATREHDIQMGNLREQLHNSHNNLMMKLETKLTNEHNDELNALRKEHEEKLEYEKNRINAEIEKLKMEQREKMATLGNRIKASVEENVSSVFNNII